MLQFSLAFPVHPSFIVDAAPPCASTSTQLGAVPGAFPIRDRDDCPDSKLNGLDSDWAGPHLSGRTVTSLSLYFAHRYIRRIEELVCLQDKELLRD